MKNEIVFFETEEKKITLPVHVDQETVWLNRNQLAELFGRDVISAIENCRNNNRR